MSIKKEVGTLNFFNCREIYERWQASSKGKRDVHTKLMKKYADIPQYWFYILLAGTLLVSLCLCIFLKNEVQMPAWALLLAAFIAFVFTLPISIITATTNQVSTHECECVCVCVWILIVCAQIYSAKLSSVIYNSLILYMLSLYLSLTVLLMKFTISSTP